MIFYEAPHRLVDTLEELAALFGEERQMAATRELTKKFETIMPTSLSEALIYYEENDPRGEYVLVIEGKSIEELEAEKQKSFEQIPIEEHVADYEKQGYDHKEAMKLAAKDRGITKREVYQYLLNIKK